MCRTTDYPVHMDRYRSRRLNLRHRHIHDHASFFNLKINSFFLRLLGFNPTKPLPDSLTLLFLPRINENALQIHGFTVRPDSPAFVSLHRLHRPTPDSLAPADLIFGTREPVIAGDGVQFEVYLRDTKLLKGLFRKDDAHIWKLDCTCELLDTEQKDFTTIPGLSEAQLCVAMDGSQTMTQKVGMVLKRRKKNPHYWHNSFKLKEMGLGLDEIPELSDEYSEEESQEGGDDACSKCTCQSQSYCGLGEPEDGQIRSQSRDTDVLCRTTSTHGTPSPSPSTSLHMDTQGVGWALDFGIWAMCLGVGFLVSRASVNSIRRKIKF